MARTNLGRVVPLHKGVYSAQTPYELNDVVDYEGGTYWHATHDVTTGVDPTDATVWKLIARNYEDVEHFAERAEAAAISAESYAGDAQSAQTAAEAAQADAETAESNAETAQSAAEAAQSGAVSAKTGAETARAGAEAAQTAAETAETNAASSAQSASSSASAASTAASAAAGSASAAQSAQSAAETAQASAETASETATQAKNDAMSAKNDSVAAKNAAVSAKDAAVSAKDDAVTAKNDAVSAKNDAVAAKTAAETAQTASETAQTAAESAKDLAVAANTDAQTAKTDAEKAKADAVSAKTDAQTAKTAAETAQAEALASATAASNSEQGAVSAKNAAQSAQTAAETAKTAAQSAQTAAETARTAAQSAQTGAETAKAAAEAAQTAAETAESNASDSATAAGTSESNASASASSAESARAAAVSAQTAAQTAKAQAETAADRAEDAAEAIETYGADSEAWAVGKRGGVDVPSTDPAYNNNAKYYASHTGGDTNAVRFVEQALTEQEKAQARQNINAAATDGFYYGMGVGNAEQLIASVGVTDKVPYNFRTAGGSADVGNRENDKIVGGTICWNQLVQNGNFESTAYWDITGGNATAENNTIVFVGNNDTTDKYICTNIDNKVNDKYFMSFSYQSNRDFSQQHTSGSKVLLANTKFEQVDFIEPGAGQTYSALYFYNYNGVMDWTLKLKNVMLFNLTQMFGSTIADYIYSLEQATAGAGVAWFKKLFPKPYYEYNAGELMSVCTNEHKTVGFNAWDEEWESGFWDLNTGIKIAENTAIRSKNVIPVLSNTIYCFTSQTSVVRLGFFDANMNYLGIENAIAVDKSEAYYVFITPQNAKFMVFYTNGTTYNHDICINLSWSSYRNGEYEPYVEHRYPLSPIELRGIPKLDSANNLYFDGDTYEKNGKITRKYKLLDLGTLNYTYISNMANKYFRAYLSDSENVGPFDIANAKIVNYRTVSADTMNNYLQYDKCFSVYSHAGELWIDANGYTDPAAFKSVMSGVYLVYKLATPITETINPFTDPQIVDDFGTEEYVDALATAETNPRDVEVPVGHETFYQANLRDKLQNLPVNASADGLYLVKQTGNKQELIAYTPEAELPTVQAEGTYVLKSVNGVLTWVLES